MHGSNLTQREGVDLFNVTTDLLLWWEVLFYLPPLKKYNIFLTELAQRKKRIFFSFVEKKQPSNNMLIKLKYFFQKCFICLSVIVIMCVDE